jgi:protein TonB
MAFRALLFSKSHEANTAMMAACESTGIRAECCSDIFTAIEKVKTRAFSCVIPDWADQPEASFLLKRARESNFNRDMIAIAIVDNEPTATEMRDNRIGFLIYRPVSVEEADAVLAKACEQMQPLSVQDAAEPVAQPATSSQGGDATQVPENQPNVFQPTEAGTDSNGEIASDENEERHHSPGHAIRLREFVAAILVVAAVFFFWRSRDTFTYLARTPEGASRVLRESVAALFYMTPSGALPVSSASSDARQDAYFSRNSANSSGPAPELGIAATESNLAEARLPLSKASDFPLPVPVLIEPPAPAPVYQQRAAIPESMRNSPPMARPVIVTVSPAQMMPVSAPQSQPVPQQFSEPISMSEDAARARLLESVPPAYPQEGLAQKLHGPVVLRALIGRDGSVEDLKIVQGYFILGRAAIAAVKQWRFQPYTAGGHAVSTQTQITINFSYPPG